MAKPSMSRLESATEAFKNRDLNASRHAHNRRREIIREKCKKYDQQKADFAAMERNNIMLELLNQLIENSVITESAAMPFFEQHKEFSITEPNDQLDDDSCLIKNENYSHEDMICVPKTHEHWNASKDRVMSDHPERVQSILAEYLRQMVFGGIDGICTVFAVLSATFATGIPIKISLAIGMGQVVSGAIAMGLGEYYSDSTAREFAKSEEERERWEVENYPCGEIYEMMEIYMDKGGMSFTDARVVAETLSKYKEFWIDHMMRTELNIQPSDSDEADSIKTALAMFSSFLLFGSLPLIVTYLYTKSNFNIIDDFLETNVSNMIVAAIGSLSALACLGALKAGNIGTNKVRGAITMIIQGSLVGVSSYFISSLFPSN